MKIRYPIFSMEAAREFEASILKGDEQATEEAMVNAGTAIGTAIFEDYHEAGFWPDSPNILVLCGKGLNTGDAFVACQCLRRRLPGLKVRLVMTTEEAELSPIAGRALGKLQFEMGESLQKCSLEAFLEAPEEPVEVVIDGLYGLGFRPPLREGPGKLMDLVNQRTDIVMRVSIDLPSGVSKETDAGAFRADFTYMPGVAKEPCFKEVNGQFTGRMRFLEIHPFLEQPEESSAGAFVAAPSAFKELGRLRPPRSDKRNYGHCLILAGSANMPGAALMATLGALQSGAGLVTTLTTSAVSSRVAGEAPEAMWRTLPVNHDGGLEVESVRIVSRAAAHADALLIGPGLVMDRATTFCVSRIVRESPLSLILDASALTTEVITAVLGRSLSFGPVVVTPHRGEFARILPVKEDPESNESLLNFSRKFRIITVLKGSPTIICDGRSLTFTPAGGPVLSRGGSGDILAGMTCTLLAQNPEDPLKAAIMATTWHGAAADLLARSAGSVAVRTTDLLPYLSPSLRS